MSLKNNEIEVLRELGAKYAQIAALPVHSQTIGLWKALNRGSMERPMVNIDQLPWHEFSAIDGVKCVIEDPFWRDIEENLRQTIFKWNYLPADMVVEPFITIPLYIKTAKYGLTAHVEKLELSEGSTAPSQHYESILNDFDDISKIKDIGFNYDKKLSDEYLQEAHFVFDGIVPIKQGHGVWFHLGVWDYLSTLFTVENAYYDLVDRPEFIHACMERVTAATIAGIQEANELNIHDDTNPLCHCSYIYTDEYLPAPGEGKGTVSNNCWSFGMAQLFTSVSPAVTEEFELPYITRMAKYFGNIYYGCCDRLDDRMDLVMKIPNLAKVSCSPWSDRKRFAEKIGNKIIMSNKPTPAYVASESVDWNEVRRDLQYTYDVAKANNVNLEMILKDVSTVRGDVSRLTKWADIAREIVTA